MDPWTTAHGPNKEIESEDLQLELSGHAAKDIVGRFSFVSLARECLAIFRISVF